MTRSAPIDQSDVRDLYALQHAASRSEPSPDLAARLDRLARLRAVVSDGDKAFADAIAADFGHRSRHETAMMEVVPLLSWIRHEPLGVVGIISPWNYPLMLALSPLVDVLAAGNRALIKPSEITPALSALLAERIASRFRPDEVAVVTGDAEVAAAFAALPFDHLVFTGSTATGRKVMQAAAANLTPVTLELGGKSPAIVGDDYPIEAAARSIALGKLVNAGQTCIAPDYILVPRAKLGPLADALMARFGRMYPKIAGNDDYTTIISRRHYDRLTSAVEAARTAGATILRHGDDDIASRRIAPTLVLDAPSDSLLLTEEIFGPVLPLVAYDTLDEALAFVVARERPLALYAFSHDAAVTSRILAAIPSGGVTLNGTLLHIAQEDLPFGGIGPSGMGAYHGHDGFLRFSHARAVHKIGRFSAFERLGPPWGRLASGMVAMLKR